MLRATAALPLLLLGACGQAPDATLDQGLWAAYRAAYIETDGRVIDTGQGGISHSEGQGYGMLLAEAAADRVTFDRIWTWTQRHLQVRQDALLAWRWDPASRKVTDSNNATDGDLLVAWALLRAAHRWHAVSYRHWAWQILDDVRSRLIVSTDRGPVLLPGMEGFVHQGLVTANPAYNVFPALSHFARLQPSGPWSALREHGYALLDDAAFGPWRLPPDWLTLADPPAPASNFPARFGYEAVRIPLYACWDDPQGRQALGGIRAFWASTASPPAWISLETGEQAPFPLAPGASSIRQLLLHGTAASGTGDATMPGNDYYDATLLLLASVAANESLG